MTFKQAGGLERRDFLGALAATLAAGVPALSQAQGRLTRFYVGFPPGGSTDVVARLAANHARRAAGDSGIVDNVPGAAGRLAMMRVKSGPVDGSSVLVSPAAMFTLYPHVYTRLAYDPFKDFIPVTAVGVVDFALVVSAAAVPAQVRTLQDLGAWLRANPQHRSFATGGTGTPMHFLGVMVAKHLGMDLTHVAYKGATPMVQDLLGGQIAVGVTVVGDSLPHIESGRLRVIAVSSTQRSSFLPQTPTFGESGAPQIVAQESFGLYLPAGASADTVNQLAASVRAALSAPEVKTGLEKLACTPSGLAPAEFQRFLRADFDRWGPVVKSTGFSLDE